MGSTLVRQYIQMYGNGLTGVIIIGVVADKKRVTLKSAKKMCIRDRQRTDEHKIEERVEKQAVEEQIREMADDVEIPESLKPENIEKMLTEKGGKKPFRWKAAYSAAAAAACCVIVVGIAVFGGLGGHKDMLNTESTSAADAGGTNEAKADTEASGTSDTVIASARDYDCLLYTSRCV